MLIQKFDPNSFVRIITPAKLNLFLDILGKRPDGYHDVSTVMCPVDLLDELEIQIRQDGEIALEMDLPPGANPSDPAWQIPTNATNLICKAAKATQLFLGINLGCNIRLRKRIPAAAGLGGGSSNAAAAVVGCLAVWANWDRSVADQICQGLGSDLNFFLGSPDGTGIMHATGRGERVNLLHKTKALSFWLIHPPQGCSTGQVFSKVRIPSNLSKTEEFIATCQDGQDSKIGAGMFNALQLPACEINDWIERQLFLLSDCGCTYPVMSGSGSSCFAFAPENGSFEQFQSRANQIGIQRVYQVNTWYQESIELQLSQLATQ